jgi:pimeloyl-ACP methyl ester carboxylesterase
VHTASSSDGVLISYEVAGSGARTLVLIHGWACDRNYWSEQIEAFSEDYLVVTVDLAGHGASGTIRSSWTIRNFAEDVAAVVHALGARDVVLIGHSLGGPVAVEASLLLPDQVKAVVGVDTFFDFWARSSGVVENLREDFSEYTRGLVRRAMFTPASNTVIVDRIANAMASAPPEIAAAAMEGLVNWSQTRADSAISAAPVPVGLIMAPGGVRSTAGFQEAYSNSIRLGIEEMREVGHFLMIEAPEDFNALLRRMLGRL